ncbi:MAG: lasso peptide biosynthesis PqqD family chaperone [Kouleothrix sp.]|nr:lasso peptide biosynthesis PqqD family chaperone [Kouleothrix sp.]
MNMELRPMLSNDSIVVVSPDQVSSDLAGEVVMLNLKNGTYYGLDEVGAHVWALIQEPRAVAAIRDSILAEYDVEPERCEQDLLALLGDLADNGLIEVRDEWSA